MDPTQILFEKLAGQGITVVLLSVAVWWLNRGNAAQVKATRAALTDLNRERTDRIEKLESAVNECQQDRKDLASKLVALALDFARLREDAVRRPGVEVRETRVEGLQGP